MIFSDMETTATACTGTGSSHSEMGWQVPRPLGEVRWDRFVAAPCPEGCDVARDALQPLIH